MEQFIHIDDNALMYIAYFKHNKYLVAYGYDKHQMELYLMRSGIYDQVNIYESKDSKFNDAIKFEKCPFRLMTINFDEKSFICTEREMQLLNRYEYENETRIKSILNDMSYLLNTINFSDKEKDKIFKASKILYEKCKNEITHDLIPKGCLDNKTLRRLREMEDELIGETPGDFSDCCHKYCIIMI